MALYIYPLTPVTVSVGGGLATEATLADVKTAVEAIEAKDFATETTLAALAAEDFATQTTLAAADSKLDSIDQAQDQIVVSLGQIEIFTQASATEATLADVKTAVESIAAEDFATQTTLASLNAKVTAVDTGAVVVSSSALPSGASTEATLSALNAKVTAVNTGAVVVSSSALPTGAATEATLSALNAKVTAVDTGAVVVSSSALPSGAATSAKQDTLLAAFQRSVVDQIDTTPLLDTSSTNIPASASNPVAVIASTAAAAYKVVSVEDIGEFIGLYTGAALSEVLLCVLPLGGGEIEVNIPAGTRLSLRNMKNAAISSGFIALNLVG